MAMPIEKLDELLEEKEQGFDESFKIDNLKLAIWADEKVLDAELKLKEIDRLAEERISVLQAKIDKLNEWREEAKKPYIRTVEYFKSHLLTYLFLTIEEQIRSGANKIIKTIKLPFRDLVSRSQQPEIMKEDDKLLSWAEENAAEFVETKPVLKWGELKKKLIATEKDGQLVYVDENGEIVPHIKLISRPDVLDWKVKE